MVLTRNQTKKNLAAARPKRPPRQKRKQGEFFIARSKRDVEGILAGNYTAKARRAAAKKVITKVRNRHKYGLHDQLKGSTCSEAQVIQARYNRSRKRAGKKRVHIPNSVITRCHHSYYVRQPKKGGVRSLVHRRLSKKKHFMAMHGAYEKAV